MEKSYSSVKCQTLEEIVGIESTRALSVSVSEDAHSNHLGTYLENGECTFEVSFPLGTIWVIGEKEKK